MNNKLAQFAQFVSRIDRRHMQLLLVVLTVAMLVLGVGAPVDGGGPSAPAP